MNFLKIILGLLLLLISGFLMGQKVENVRYEQERKEIIVYYDLAGKGRDPYLVKIYYSSNKGVSWTGPLERVSGDVGEDISPGKDKQIKWDVLEEQEKLSGYVQFKVTAEKENREGYFTDPRDGQKYKSVKIGTQVWMAENLNYRTSSGSWCYNDRWSSNCNTYGRLYDWRTAKRACPAGWHLPSDREWQALVDFLRGDVVAGDKLKEAGFTHWKEPNTGATNSSGFTALPGGYRNANGYFYYLGVNGYFWSSTEDGATYAWKRKLSYDSKGVSRYSNGKDYGLSVRCLRD